MLIRQSAFENPNRKMLKGALHCHTTRSDGSGTPEEVIRLHAQNGYDFMALTDHRRYNYKNFAPDVKMTIIPGTELDWNLEGEPGCHCFHIVCLGHEKNNPFVQDEEIRYDGRVRNQFAFQPVLDDLHVRGQMTMYCHPDWSGTPAHEFMELQGNFAMELWNSGCVLVDNMDTDNGLAWDTLLTRGRKIFGTAVDDGHPMNQHCKGWVRVNAENDVDSILAALENGRFYASCGPEIYDFCLDGNNLKVECSPVRWIAYRYGLYPTQVVRAEEGKTITSAERQIPDFFKYVRVIVEDEQGRRAWTNPIFIEVDAAKGLRPRPPYFTNTEVIPMDAQGIRILGDSILKGVVFDTARNRYVLLKENAIQLLTEKLRIPLQNASVMGRTAPQTLARYEQEAPDASMNQLVVLELGGNDSNRDWKAVSENPDLPHEPITPIPVFEQSMRTLIERVRERGGTPVVCTLPPIDCERYFRWITKDGLSQENILSYLGSVHRIYDYQELYSSICERIAVSTGSILVPIREAFLREMGRRNVFCEDGIHPNAEGHRIIAQEIIRSAARYCV